MKRDELLKFLENSASRTSLKEIDIYGRRLPVDIVDAMDQLIDAGEPPMQLKGLWFRYVSMANGIRVADVSQLKTLNSDSTIIDPTDPNQIISRVDQLKYLDFRAYVYDHSLIGHQHLRDGFKETFQHVVALTKKNLSCLRITEGHGDLNASLANMIKDCGGNDNKLKALGLDFGVPLRITSSPRFLKIGKV